MTTSQTYHHKFTDASRRLLLLCASLLLALCFGKSSTFGQTLNTANFYCANNEPSGDVFLLWDEPINPCGPFLGYVIYASTSVGGPYTALDTINPASNTSYTHVGADGNVVTWYYYIVALFDCPGWTTPTSDTLDNLDPVFPELDYVTVVGGSIEVNWLPSVSPEAYAYIIYRQTTGFTPIDTVFGRFTTSYSDFGASPGTQPELYTVATMDSCRRLGVFSPISHNSIFLEVLSQECDGLLMRWNAYENWASGVDSYEIWAGIDGGPLGPVDTVDNTTLEYTWFDAPGGTDVCVVIRAIRGDGTAVSTSNEICLNTGGLSSALFAHFRIATISNPGETTLEWYPDAAADLYSWRMETSSDGMDWTGISTQPFLSSVPTTLTYVAENTSPGSWFRASTLDGCDDEKFSEPCRTIRLQGNADFDLTNSLKWNAPVIFGATITGYNIYRTQDSIFTFLDAVGPAELDYEDDVTAFLDGEGNFCYKIDAVYTLDLPDVGILENHFTLSNEVCIEQFVRVYVPNAIVPNGTNNVFKPVLLFDQEGSFEMEIFDRYGKVVFTSSDPANGWDGRVNGEVVPGGAYAYVIRFLANNGREVIKKGSFLVMR